MPLTSRAVRNPDSTPEDDNIKWLRVQEIFKQHFERVEAEKRAAEKVQDV